MHILNNPRWLTFFSRNILKTKQKKNNQFLPWQIHMFKSYGALAIEKLAIYKFCSSVWVKKENLAK
jgi:hypothetical protein